MLRSHGAYQFTLQDLPLSFVQKSLLFIGGFRLRFHHIRENGLVFLQQSLQSYSINSISEQSKAF